MNYVRNAWYVAGWSSELDESLKRVVILEQAIVMYCRSDGAFSELEEQSGIHDDYLYLQ